MREEGGQRKGEGINGMVIQHFISEGGRGPEERGGNKWNGDSTLSLL